MRARMNDAMDIHGGRAIQDGPSNYLFSGYMNTPVAITVEGANILTRTLITFAQGALRAHPFLYKEVAAAQNPDRRAGLLAFDAAFAGHVGFMLRNVFGSFLHAVSFGAFASTPVQDEMAHWYRQLSRYAQSFALVGDWTVAFLGGELKARQALSGRLADILSELYVLSATLKRYEDEGRLPEDRPVVDAVARDAIARIEEQFNAVCSNFPKPWLGGLMLFLVFPLGRHARPAHDAVNLQLARAVLKPGSFRDRLTVGTYVSYDPRDVTGILEDALIKVDAAEAVEAKFIRAVKKGIVERRLDRDAIADAVAAGVITGDEAAMLRTADEATDRVIRVDDFSSEDLMRIESQREPQHDAAE
jgi:acyl-CoA dehydrogenase